MSYVPHNRKATAEGKREILWRVDHRLSVNDHVLRRANILLAKGRKARAPECVRKPEATDTAPDTPTLRQGKDSPARLAEVLEL